MEFVNAKNLDPCGTMEQEHGVIVLQDGKLKQMKLADLLNYVASSSIESDKTLTLDGVAADAKVTGEEIGKRINKSGDTMTGELGMSGNRVTGLGEPVDAGDAATKAYVDGKHIVFGATISASGWQDWGNGYYAITITANGLLSTDYPHITLNHSIDTIVSAKEEYSKIRMAWTDTNLVAFLCYEDTPTIDLNISVEVNR